MRTCHQNSTGSRLTPKLLRPKIRAVDMFQGVPAMNQSCFKHTHDLGVDPIEGEDVRLVQGVIWAVLLSIPMWVAAIAALF